MGAHVIHDELWELYVHSRFWFYTHQAWGWSVAWSYQVLSSLAGGVFIYLLLTYCAVLMPDRPGLAVLLSISGGYMQLFFGDVENYTLTATWVMGYFLAALLFLKQKASVIIPALLLAIALTFHLLAGFLIPSLIYLGAVAWKRGARRQTLLAAGGGVLIVILTLLFFHLKGWPISDLWYNSHAFGGGNIRRMLVRPTFAYYLAIFNLAFLLAPGWMLIAPLLIFKRIRLDMINIHLLIASAFMALLVLGWHAQLGVYQDWNLFAIAALPIAFLVWRNVLHIPSFRARPWPIAVMGLLFFVHSYSWIVSNHLLSPVNGG